MNLQHKVKRQRNFIPAPTEPEELIVNRPVVLQHKMKKQEFMAASGVNTNKK